MKSPHAVESKERRLQHYLDIVSDVALIVMTLRDRPTRLDWVAAGGRATALAMKFRARMRRDRKGGAWDVFESEEWRQLPKALGTLALGLVNGVEVVTDFGGPDEAGPLHCRGRIGDEEASARLDWIDDGDGFVRCGPAIAVDRWDATMRAMGRALWKELGTERLRYDGAELVPDDEVEAVETTHQFAEVRDRLGLFLQHGIPRSVLFEGPPGTGKTTGIRGLVSGLGLRSLRLDLDAFTRLQLSFNEERQPIPIRMLVELLRPDVLILDDIDRRSFDSELLAFLEEANRKCKFVLASANNADKLDDAARRPGRFDEVVRVDELDPGVLRAMVGDEEIAGRMARWPAAFVAEWVKRRKVLGEQVALEELEKLEARLASDEDEDDDEDADDERGDKRPRSVRRLRRV